MGTTNAKWADSLGRMIAERLPVPCPEQTVSGIRRFLSHEMDGGADMADAMTALAEAADCGGDEADVLAMRLNDEPGIARMRERERLYRCIAEAARGILDEPPAEIGLHVGR